MDKAQAVAYLESPAHRQRSRLAREMLSNGDHENVHAIPTDITCVVGLAWQCEAAAEQWGYSRLSGCLDTPESLDRIANEPARPWWRDAPDWAEYCAQDADGAWWWYSEWPSQDLEYGAWDVSPGAMMKFIGYASLDDVPHWLATLEARNA